MSYTMSLPIRSLGERVAREHCVTLSDIMSRSRHKTTALARAHFAALIRWTLGWSYPEIGRVLRRDHGTVIALEVNWGAHLENLAGIEGPWTAEAHRKAIRSHYGWLRRKERNMAEEAAE